MNFSDWLERSWLEAGYPIGLAALRHGRLASWLATLNRLPNPCRTSAEFGNTLTIGQLREIDDRAIVEHIIEELIPWRKGPVSIFGLEIDTEWHSNLKWDRICTCLDWRGKRVLDVGSGNGYFGFRALDAGATFVLGIESYLIYVLQAALINWFARTRNIVVPLRFGADTLHGEFDIVMSMGVIYHQRNPHAHLDALFTKCRPGGHLILESLISEEEFKPTDRYAGMRNVYRIPSLESLQIELQQVGFVEPVLLDVSKTTEHEQRTTRFMPFKSLTDFLDPADSSRTIEGLPAPTRAVFVARRSP